MMDPLPVRFPRDLDPVDVALTILASVAFASLALVLLAGVMCAWGFLFMGHAVDECRKLELRNWGNELIGAALGAAALRRSQDGRGSAPPHPPAKPPPPPTASPNARHEDDLRDSPDVE